jgi:biopolymer transport protein ExbB
MNSPWRWIIVAACLVVGYFAIASLQAQQPAPVAPATAPAPTAAPASSPVPASGGADAPVMGEGVPTMSRLFMTSAYINSGLLVMSVLATVIFFYLVLSLTSSSFNSPRFFDDVTKLIINRQFDQAIHLCQNNPQVFASSIIQRVVENRDKEHAVLMEIVASEGRRRAETIWNRINYLSEISNTAPMLGLLGTVVGMIKVFFTLRTRIVGEKIGQLSEGIAQAMGTTMFGLFVAIAAAAFYVIARSRATAALVEAEAIASSIADHTQRAASDPRLKRIDALAEAARQKITTAPTPPSIT